MENFRTLVSVPSLPDDVPKEVQLLDQAWLAHQTAEGARLELLWPEEQVTSAAVAEENARLRRRVQDLQTSLAGARLEVARLESALGEAERPAWRRTIRRS
jgi:hypothetical protein